MFFGQNDWGKLINITEDGMAMEFSELPAKGQVISFEFVPGRHDRLRNCIHTDGRVVWARQSEKISGVQFVSTGETREQIRQWLSIGTLRETCTEDQERPPIKEIASTEPLPAHEVATRLTYEGGQECTSVERNSDELVRLQLQEQHGLDGQAGSLWRLEGAALVGLALFSMLAVLTGIVVSRSRPSRTDGPLDRKAPDSGALSQTGQGAASMTARPFQVEIVDTKNKHWFLTFADSSSTRVPDDGLMPSPPKVASGIAASLAAVEQHSPSVASKKARVAPAEMAEPQPSAIQAVPGSTLAAPTVRDEATNASAEDSSSALPVPDPSEALPADTASAPGPLAGRHTEPARLISSVSPAYPALARSHDIFGDVVIDALIDPTGSVTDTKVVSGPLLLRESAMQAVRMWKYSPARLDGLPISTHLRVTLKFMKR